MGSYLSRTESNEGDGASSQQEQQQTSTISPQLEQMAQQVKDVLPQVPLSVIRRDISITTNVDESITRLLDGTVAYTPERSSPPPPASSSITSNGSDTRQAASVLSSSQTMPTGSAAAANISLNTASKTFGKTATERMKSYKERKQALIEASRLRYLAKHGGATQSND